MAGTNFDARIVELRKAISLSKSTWNKVQKANESKWRTELQVKEGLIADLTNEKTAQNNEWQEKYQENVNILQIVSQEKNNLTVQVSNFKEQSKTRNEEINAIREELKLANKNARDRDEELSVALAAADKRNANLEETTKVVQSRLGEEQKRWDDMLKMKENDFSIIRRELEQKAKGWESEYAKEQREINIVKEGREKLEAELDGINDKLREQGVKGRTELSKKDDQISALRRELDLSEKTWEERFKEKGEEVESLRRELSKVMIELTGVSIDEDEGAEKSDEDEDGQKKPEQEQKNNKEKNGSEEKHGNEDEGEKKKSKWF